MPQINLNSPLELVGLIMIVSGMFLLLAGFGILNVEKISVKPGKPTWLIGFLFSALGAILIFSNESSKISQPSNSTAMPATTPAILATTYTNTPTITPSPIPTNTSTPIPTITPLPSGILINEMPDGGTEFIDYDGGYKLTAPSSWTAIPLDEEMIDEIIGSTTEQNSQFESIIDLLSSVDKSIYRIFFFDFRSEHTNGQFVSNFNVIYQKDELVSGMPLDFLVAMTEENLTAMLPGVEVLSSNIVTLNSGIEAGEVELTQNVATLDDTEVSMYQKMIIFLTEDGMVNITFAIPSTQLDTLQPELDQIIDSIALLNP